MVRSLTLAFLVTFFAVTSAFAETIHGRITDPQSKPVANARVLITRGTVTVVTIATTADGQFGPVSVPAGEYDITVAAPGLRAAPKHVTIAAGGAADVDVALEVAAVSESVVVSAAQVDRPLSRVTDSVTVIDRADLDARQMETATDVLRFIPGFSVVASGGRGALTSIFPRGGESDYTLVLVDGIWLNSFGGGYDAAHLGTAGIDRIEVVRGPQSALFGSGAIGGVVNIITRKSGPSHFDGLMEAGGQGTAKFVAATNGSHGAWSWGGAIERLSSDGDTSFRSSIGGNVSNDDYERVVGTAGMVWSDRATRRVRVDTRFGRDERGNPGPYGSDPAGTFFGLDTVSRSINKPRGVAASATFGDAAHLRHTGQFGWSNTPSLFISQFGESDDRTRRVTGRYQADLERGRAGYSAGLEFIKERADNTFVTGSLFEPVPVNRMIAGLFVESRWDLSSRASLTAGLRGDRIQRNALEENPSPFGPRPAFDEDIVWSANPKISAVWFLRGDRSSDARTGWTKIRGGAGTGIKPPTVFEIAFTDNPSLKPERSRSADIGLEHAFPGGLVAADATFFGNHYDDLIVAVSPAWSGASQYRTDNIANASAKGLELGVRLVTTHGLSVRGAYTWMDTEILSVDNVPSAVPSPYSVGDSLVRRPRHQGSIDARYTRGRAVLFVTMNGRGDMADLEPNFASTVLTNPGFVTFNAGGSFRVARELDVYARVTNLADRAYEEALGFPAQARSATVGLRVAVGR
jgi:outer membrane cobalamin receptor